MTGDSVLRRSHEDSDLGGSEGVNSVKPDERDELIRHCLRIYYHESPTFPSAALLLSFSFQTMRLTCDRTVYPIFFWNNIFRECL